MAGDREGRDRESTARSAEEAARRAERAAAEAQRERNDTLALADAARGAAFQAAKRAGRFSREFLATVVSVVGTALGVVVALAWNGALTGWFHQFSENSRVPALFIYALFVTLLAVIVIFFLGRLARRLNAEAVQFKVETKREDR